MRTHALVVVFVALVAATGAAPAPAPMQVMTPATAVAAGSDMEEVDAATWRVYGTDNAGAPGIGTYRLTAGPGWRFESSPPGGR